MTEQHDASEGGATVAGMEPSGMAWANLAYRARSALEDLGVDFNPATAAIYTTEGAKVDQPAWLWNDRNGDFPTYGTWLEAGDQAPYIRGDIVARLVSRLAAAPTPPAPSGLVDAVAPRPDYLVREEAEMRPFLDALAGCAVSMTKSGLAPSTSTAAEPVAMKTGCDAPSDFFNAGDRVRWYHPPLLEGTVLKNNGGLCKVHWDTGEVRRDSPEKLRHADVRSPLIGHPRLKELLALAICQACGEPAGMISAYADAAQAAMEKLP